MKAFLKSSSLWFGILAVLLLVAGIAASMKWWGWLHPEEPTTVSNSETLRNVGLLIGGVLAFVFAGWRAWVAERQANAAQTQANMALDQAATAQQGLLNERYQKGAEMLGSEVLTVRLGGIYALQGLAAEHPEQYHIQIMRLFCAFVRNPTGVMEGHFAGYDDDGQPIRGIRDDVQAVMHAIGSRTDADIALERDGEMFMVDLQNVDLQRGRLEELNLFSVFLHRSNLSGAFLGYSDLSGADFGYADLSGASLPGAGLSGACFEDANLSNARFRGADLYDARFASANLTGANLEDADLTRAFFNGRDINGGFVYPAKGLTQAQLDVARSDRDNPPVLEGVLDAETGEQLVWRGRPLDDDSAEPDA